MISRRFLLSAAPAALVAASVPVKALGLGEIVTMPAATTWGAGIEGINAAWAASMLRHGLATIEEIRAAEDLAPPKFQFDLLLRGDR